MPLPPCLPGFSLSQAILETELETVGLRLNKQPPHVTFKKKKIGGIKFTAMVPLTKLGG